MSDRMKEMPAEVSEGLDREVLSLIGEDSSAATCSRLAWTSDTPGEDGWYWLRGGDSYGWWEGCVLVDVRDGDCFFEGEWLDIDGILPNAEWSDGPIPEPLLAANSEINHEERVD